MTETGMTLSEVVHDVFHGQNIASEHVIKSPGQKKIATDQEPV